MYCISVSHKKAPVNIREKFALNNEEKIGFIRKLKENPEISGCVVLCTCNRSEVYLSGGKAAIRALQEAVASIKAVPQQELLKYLNTYSGERATAHLFKVCCGFDSMVLGEDEILGQVRDAYQAALEKKHVDMMVANNLKVAGAGFGTDTNIVTLITANSEAELPQLSKEETAARIFDQILEMQSQAHA